MTRHDEELVINPSPAPQAGGVATGQQAFSNVMVMRTRNAQAYAPGGTRKSERIQKRIDAALKQPIPVHTQSLPQLPDEGVKLSKEREKGKAAYAQRALEKVKKQVETSLAPLANEIPVRTPEITVERADASVEPSNRDRGRPRKIIEKETTASPIVLETKRWDNRGQREGGGQGDARHISISACDAVLRLGRHPKH